MTEPTATFTTEGHTPVLIEDWLPIRELGIESVRERQATSALPPLSFLHVWWARAPLATAGGVTLAALLPVWDDELPHRVEDLGAALLRVRENRTDLKAVADGMTDSDWYRVWVLWMAGVWGDPVQEMERAALNLSKPSFSWKQAYKNKPGIEDLNALHQLLVDRWGHLPRVLDPTAGGGALPFSSLRLGLPTWANDLNPVAAGILDATLRAAAEHGEGLVPDIERWGDELVGRCRRRLEEFFPPENEGEQVSGYLFANTVACPRTGGPVPLSPNWWLDKDGAGTLVRPECEFNEDGSPNRIRFRVLEGQQPDFDPSSGSVSRGAAVSPWDGLTIDGSYIKDEAQSGRMWPTLYAVAIRKRKDKGRGSFRLYREPNATDRAALSLAARELERLRPRWESEGILPTQEIPSGTKTSELRRYGMNQWTDLFTERQLLVHGVFVEEWRSILPDVVQELGASRGEQLMTLLAIMQGKALDWNAKLTTWQASVARVRHVFQRHDFALKWSFAEFDGARQLLPFCLSQLMYSYSGKTSYEGISRLIQPDLRAQGGLLAGSSLRYPVPGEVTLSSRSAADLPLISTSSIELVNLDPPYYDNVQYSELSDFFYVWEKNTLGVLNPERFSAELANKDDEAVANVERFADSGKRKKELATFDYQQKMQAIFGEAHRVLVDDGVMVVWFTHKRAEAWDTLATAMMEAGFTIEASWPVTTQFLNALNHADKNSAKSTIMLVCRKRQQVDQAETFFEDIEVELRQAARSAVEKFEREVGVGGVDLQLATYGPTLSVISRNWPVLSSEPDETGRSRRLRPEEALDVARQEVARLRMQRLVGKDATFDPGTDFWLMCWETFQAREFPYDEARKLALGVGHDVEEAIKAGLLKKKSGNVELVNPTTRGRALRRLVDDSGRFEQLVDALHFMLVTYRDDKLAAARTWLSDSGYGSEQQFLDVVQAAVNAVPRVRTKKGLSLEEALLLEDAVVALFGDEISLPVEAEEQIAAEQMTLGS